MQVRKTIFNKRSANEIILRLRKNENEFQSIKRYESILRPPLYQQVVASQHQNEIKYEKPGKFSFVASMVELYNQKNVVSDHQSTYDKDRINSIYKDRRSSHFRGKDKQLNQELKENLHLKWIETEQVRSKNLAKHMKKEEIKYQESQFELISSEASYNRSLSVLVDKFYNSSQLSLVETDNFKPIIKPYQKEHLFSNILKIYTVSCKFLADLENRFCESAKIIDLSDIVSKYCSTEEFDVYVPYIQNQRFQTEAYIELKKDPNIAKVITELESQPECCSLNLNSFLILPMQRLLRILLLLKAIKANIQANQKQISESVEKAMSSMQEIIQKCSDNKIHIDERQRMMEIYRCLEFKPTQKMCGQLGQLIHEGEIRRTCKHSTKRQFKDFWFILTSEFLMMTKMSKGKEISYLVDDYCKRTEVFVEYESIIETESIFEFKLQISREQNVPDTYVIQTKSREDHRKWVSLLS